MVWNAIFCFLLLIIKARSFSLSGVTPRVFLKGDELQVKVNKLLSTKTLLPYDYYFLSYCRPLRIRNVAQNFGEVLRGDRNSFYTFHMREEQSCKMACRIALSARAAKDFKEKIDDEYRINMILDGLPVVVSRVGLDGSPSGFYEQGFRVGLKGGYVGSEVYRYFVFNHLSFTVMFHRDEETASARIVGFEVTPNRSTSLYCCTCSNRFITFAFSFVCLYYIDLMYSPSNYSNNINHEFKWDGGNLNVSTCNPSTRYMIGDDAVAPQEVDTGKEITFSYDVAYKESEVKWASRWDAYLLMNDDQIQWFSIVNSLLIMLFLCGVVAMIMIRTLFKDNANYNQLESKDEAHEGTGWKLIHGDVFRPPLNLELVSICAGSGVQMLGTTLVTMISTLLSFRSPSNCGKLVAVTVLLWLLMGFFGGYSSARLYKMFGTTVWKRSALRTSLLFPSIVLLVFFAISTLIWGEMSSWGIPFATIFTLAILWFVVSAPLVFLGGYYGFQKPAIEAPVETYKIPREIPKQPWYLGPIFSVLIGGILPFVAVLVEIPFIQTFAWMNQFCYIFGFLLVILVILMILCAEIAIVFCYLQLCSEDYNWWWRAYLNGGSSGLYLFVYSVFYFFTELEIISGIVYLGYMFIVSCAFFLVTGAIGFYTCCWFVRTIYSSVKVE